MERPSYTDALLSTEIRFIDLGETYPTTQSLNDALGIDIPVVTDNVYKDVILYSLELKDSKLTKFISDSLFTPSQYNGIEFITEVLALILSQERKSGVDTLLSQFMSNELEKAHFMDRQYLSQTGVLGRDDDYQTNIEKLGLIDTLLYQRRYPEWDRVLSHTVEMMVGDPSRFDNTALFGSLEENTLISCLAIAYAVRNNRDLSTIKALCNLMIYASIVPTGGEPTEGKPMGDGVLTFILRGCQSDLEMLTPYRSSVYLAVCVIEEVYGSSIAELIASGVANVSQGVINYFAPDV